MKIIKINDLILLSMVLFNSLILSCSENARPDSSAMFRGNITRNSLYDNDTVNSVKDLKWKFVTGGVVRSTPVIANGKVFFGSGDSVFYALDSKDGQLLWSFKATGAVHSSALIAGGKVYFGSTDNTLFALDENSGKLDWKFEAGKSVPYDWTFDYYVSSPVLYDNVVYAGSGNGHVYALNAVDGKKIWDFKTGSIVRSSPSVGKALLYVGDFAGKLYALDIKTGKEIWHFTVRGANDDNLKAGFDRKAIIASPVLKDNFLITGSRDGILYCLDASSGKEIWNFNYDTSWVISSVCIKDSIVVCATSSNQFINAINIQTGKQIWRKKTAYVFSSPFISGKVTVCNDVPGELYFLDIFTGEEKSRYRISNDKVFSSPVLSDGVIFIGADDGILYALNTSSKKMDPSESSRKAVYWVRTPFDKVDTDPFGNSAKGFDLNIKDFFADQGYTVLDDSALKIFFLQHIKDTLPSVVIFASNYFPTGVYDTLNRNNILMQYLKTGGKIVVTGLNPGGYVVDKAGNWNGFDYDLAEKIMGIHYGEKDTRPLSSYTTIITKDGVDWGIEKTCVAFNGINKDSVSIVLATNENGKAAWWVRSYNARKGSGFIQLSLFPSNGVPILPDVKRIAEYAFY